MAEGRLHVIDSHAHLADERFAGEEDALMERARSAGVRAVVSVATHADDAPASIALAERHADVFATAGVHPHAAERSTAEARARVEELCSGPRVVAVGETGLDYFYDNAPREAQRESFAWHLDLGRRTGLPVVVHAREADDDARDLIREAGAATRGVLHCFTAGRELMEAALELGWYVSFSGIITFSRYSEEDAALLRAVPADRVLIETDSPYLAPAPHRGRRNEPAFVVEVARRAAEIRGEATEDFAAATVRNTIELFGLNREGRGVAAPTEIADEQAGPRLTDR